MNLLVMGIRAAQAVASTVSNTYSALNAHTTNSEGWHNTSAPSLGTGSHSGCFWFKLNSNTVFSYAVVTGALGSTPVYNQLSLFVRYISSGTRWHWGGSTAGYTWASDVCTFTDTASWHHLAWTCNNSTGKLNVWIDNVKKLNDNSGTGGSYSGSTGISLGRDPRVSSGNTNFEGYMDEIALFDGLLSTQDVSDLYDKSLVPSSHADCVRFWRVEDNGNDSKGTSTLSKNGTTPSYSSTVPFSSYN